MPQRLTNVRLNEVSLVDSPANKHARVMLFKRAAEPQWDDGNYPSSILKREFSDKERKHLASTGAAMPGGGYPIEDEQDLKNAIRAIGRAKDPGKTKAHIRSRAKALGLTSLIPDTWGKRDSGNATIMYLAKRFPKVAAVAKDYGDGEAVDFDTAQEKAEASEEACGLMDEVHEAVCALSQAVWSIECDATVTDKGEAIQECLEQFGEHVKTIVPEGVENALVAESLSQSGYAINSKGGIELSKGADSMSMKEIAKRLGLAESASETAILSAFDKAEKEKAEKEKEEKEKAEKMAAAVKKMSAKHRAYMAHPDATMPKGGKEAFSEMEPGERDDHMSKHPIEDEDDDEDGVEKAIRKGDAFRTSDGVVLRKKDFGTDAGFQFAKRQAADNASLKADIAKAKDETEEKKRKEEAEKSMSFVGKSDAIGSLLFRIAKHDPKLADEVGAVLKGASESIHKGAVLKEHGSSQHVTAGSAVDLINTGAAALLKAEPTLKTIEKARTEFRKRNPDIRKAEEAEAKAARAAA